MRYTFKGGIWFYSLRRGELRDEIGRVEDFEEVIGIQSRTEVHSSEDFVGINFAERGHRGRAG